MQLLFTQPLVPRDAWRDKRQMRLPRPIDLLIDMALPPRCPGCGVITAADHQFCVACWSALHFLAPPWCAACQRPFAFDRGVGALCGVCLETPPLHAGIFAAVTYGDVARDVVLRLKYGGRMALARTLAERMARLMPQGADLLVPVPLHRWRIWARGFNQAALIARELTDLSGVPSELGALRRIKPTPPMARLSARGRLKAVAGAFNIASARLPAIRGKAIVLVDDVHTSGATSNACVRVLLEAGAANVSILCWARVLDGPQDD